MFKSITVDQNSVDYANTDYYAYLLGMQSMANPEALNINVFVTPGIDYVNNLLLVNQAINIAEIDRADSVYITTTPDFQMFVPSASDQEDAFYPQTAVDNLIDSGIDSNYTATYYPWILTRDSVTNTQLYIPPTAEVTRNLALTDNIAFPWFATAGYTRGLVNGVKARRKLSQEDRDVLYEGRINPIATFSDVGTVIWGNKTLQIAQSALDRLNVRRLLLQARKLISAVSVRLLFEQNDDIVRQQFLDSVNPILDSIRRDRGLYDFRVTVRNTPEDLDNNRLVGSIYIKPTRALEFIDITFYITPTGASFENV
jgi:phage tail sheath protein FI